MDNSDEAILLGELCKAIALNIKETTALKHSTQNRDYWKMEAPEIAKCTFLFVLEKRRISIIFHP